MTAFTCVDDLYRSLIDECSSLDEKNLEMEDSILETLFRDQKYDLILYALEKGFTLSSERIEQIKVSGDLKLYQYLFQHKKIEINWDLMASVVKSGNIETVKWLRENECPWSEMTCTIAAFCGHLDLLKWLRKNGCHWDERTCAFAAEEGHLTVLKWARENGCPWDQRTCLFAASKGHLDILKWARENGCPWDKWTCVRAAEGGYLEILKYARENGCPWDKEQCLRYAKHYPKVMEWIKAN